MSDQDVSENPVQRFTQPMVGLPAWGVHQGYGSFLTLEFGQPKLEVRQGCSKGRVTRTAHVRGQWHLWIYFCNWRVLQGETQLAWSEDDAMTVMQATNALNGQKLLTVSVSPEEGRSSFTFDLGGRIETWAYGDDPTEEQWLIYGEAETFSYRADGTYAQGSATTPLNEVSWLPLER